MVSLDASGFLGVGRKRSGYCTRVSGHDVANRYRSIETAAFRFCPPMRPTEAAFLRMLCSGPPHLF